MKIPRLERMHSSACWSAQSAVVLGADPAEIDTPFLVPGGAET